MAVWALTSWTESIAYLAGGACCAAKLDLHMHVCLGITTFPLVLARRISVNEIVALSGSLDSSVSALGSPVAVGSHILCLG